MKTRTALFAPHALRARRRFTLRPASLAVLLVLGSAGALALPQGATVVSGQVTVGTPSTTQQLITQGSQRAVIDWKSFSIGAGERVRFMQPSSTAVVLNRVTGYDPSAILGRMEANGTVFLLNPYGVVFGANARVDVGGLVASTLSLSTADFNAGRYQLGAGDTPARGEVRNDGRIDAPGGTVVLAGPQVTNTGRISADGGHVGLAAAGAVLVDVEGDGLVLFQARASDAVTRLEQLGRIHANGGTVELRAAARGSFADTVLNMAGVVQARGLGQQDGRIVIAGGDSGITRVDGRLDVSGRAADQTGGRIDVSGERVLIDHGARIEATGAVGGGTVRIGGGYQGREADIANADATLVATGARLRADALQQGDGGRVVVWSDGHTRFAGSASVRGAGAGGHGGLVETSGKGSLDVAGRVDARAAHGKTGTWLLDPTNIDVVASGGDTTLANADEFGDATPAVARSKVDVALINGASADVVLQATNDIVFETAVTMTTGVDLTAQAGRNIDVKNAVAASGGGNIRFSANDQSTGSGATGVGRVSITAAVTGGVTGTVTVTNNGSSNANVLDVGAGSAISGALGVTLTGATTLGDTTVVSAGTGGVAFNGAVSGAEALTVTTTGTTTFAGAVDVASLASTGTGGVALNGGSVTTTGTQTYAGVVTLGGDSTLTGTALSFNNATTPLAAAAHDITLNTRALTFGAGAITGEAGATATLAGFADADTVSLASATVSTANFSQADLAKLGQFDAVTVGRSGGTGAISVGALTLSADTRFVADTATVGFTGAITGATNPLSTDTTGLTTLGAAATGLSTLDITGPARIGTATVTTSGAQTYGAAVTLAATTTLTAASVDIAGAVNALASGVQGLTVNAGGSTRFRSTVGATTALAALTTNAAGSTTLTGDVTTTGAQTYNDAVTLAAATEVAGSALSFNAAVDGAFGLTAASAGTSTFGGAVDIASLASTGTGGVALNGGSVTTTGAQTYAGIVTLGADSVLTGTALSFNNATTPLAAAAHDITLRTRALTFGAGNITGEAGATATLAGYGDADSVSLATATVSTANFTQAELSKLGQFDTVTVGRANGSGAITVGALALSADTRFVADTATVDFTGAVTGAEALTVTSAGNTTFGSTVSIASLSAAGTGGVTVDGGSVTTTGAQTYAGTVTLGADSSFSGTALSFNNATTPLAAAGNDLTLRTRALSFGAGALTGGAGATASIGGFADADTVSVATGTVGTANFSQADVTKLGGFDTLSIGRTNGSGNITVGALALATDTALIGTSANLSLTTVDGNAHTLSLATGDPVTASGSLTDLASLSVADAVTFSGAAVTTTGAQTYADLVTLGASTTFTGTALAFNNAGTALAAGARSLGLRTRSLTFNGNVTSTGAGGVTLAGFATADTIEVGAGAAGALANFNQGVLDDLGNFGSLTIGRSTNGTGAITVNAITLPQNTTFTGTTATLAFTGAVDGDGHTLASTITTGLTTLTSTASTTGLASLAIAGPTRIEAAAIVSTGTQTYTGAVTLGADTTLTGSGVAFVGTVNGAQSLTVNASGVTSFGGAVGGSTPLTTLSTNSNGSTTVGSNVSASVAINVNDALSLSGDSTFSAPAINLNNATTVLAAGVHDIALRTDALSFGAGTVSGTGAAGLAPYTAAAVLDVATGAGETVSQATLNKFGGFGTLTLGRSDGTGAITVGALTLPTDLAFVGDTATVAFTGAVAGAGHALSTDSGGLTTLGAALGNLASLSIAGDTALNLASVGTTGTQTYTGALTLSADSSLSASGITIGSLVGGTSDLRTVSNALAIVAASGSGDLRFEPSTAGTTIGVAGATGTLQLDASLLNQLGSFGSLTIGRSDGTGTITAGAFTLPTATTLEGGSAAVALTGIVSGSGQSLTLANGGGSTVSAGLNNLASLSIGGSAALNGGSVTTSGTQTYAGAVTLGATTTLTGTDVEFASTLNGARALTVNASGTTRFGGVVGGSTALTALTTNAAGSTVLGGNVSTSGAQTYNDAVTLGASSTVTGSAVRFNGTLDGTASGAQALTVNAAGATVFGAAVGATQPLASLATNAGGTVSLRDVSTVGDITLGENATLNGTLNTGGGNFSAAGSTTLAGTLSTVDAGAGDVDFTGAVLGTAAATQSLAVNSSGTTTFGATVASEALPLASLATNASGSTRLGGSVFTSGAQSFGDNVVLTADAVLDALSLEFGAGLNVSTFDLTLQYDLTLTGPASAAQGSGFVSLAPRNAASTIGVAGGAGTFQVSQAALDSLTSLPNLGVGRTDGSGTLTVDSLTLRSNFRLQSGSGAIDFTGAVNGANNALTVATGGLTTVGGTVSGLTSLSITGAATLSGGSITSSGAQTYGGAVTLGADATLTASAVTFSSTVNGANDLSVNASGLTTFGAAVGGTTALASLTTDAGGSTRLGGNVSTSGAQSYGDAVTLTANSVLTASSTVDFASTLDGARTLSVNASGLTRFGAAVGETTALTKLTIDGSTQLDANVNTSGEQNYLDALTLGGTATLAATSVNFAGTVDGAHALTVNASAATSFGAAVGSGTALASLRTLGGGTTTLPGSVTTSGAQRYDDAVTLSADTALNASALSFNDDLVAGAFALTIRADALVLSPDPGDTVTGTGALDIATATINAGIGLAGGTGTLQLSSALLAKLTPFASLTLGRSDGTGTITAGTGGSGGSDFTLPTDTTITGGSAPLNLNGDLIGAGHTLDITTGGRTTVASSLTGLASLSVAADTRLNGAIVTTTGAQTYGGEVTLLGHGTLSGATLRFDEAIDGARTLRLASTGGSRFDAPVGATTALGALIVDGPMLLNGGSVATTGTHTYNGAVTLGSDHTLSGGNISFNATLDGARALRVEPSGRVAFADAVGGDTALTILRIIGDSRLAGGALTTTDTQRYEGAVTLAADTTFNGSSLRFYSTVDGAHTITSNATGSTMFNGAVGGGTALSALTVTNATALGASVTTSGAQNYGGAVTVTAASTLDAASIDFAGTLDGPAALGATTTGALNFGGAVGARVALATLTADSGGATRLGASVTTTGAQRYNGPVTLSTDTTLSGSAVVFNGTLNGAHALQVNATGITRFAAEVGGSSALASLVTDAPGSTQIGADVNTSGVQTYNDPVLLIGDSTLKASNLRFGQSFNASTFEVDLQAGTVVFGGKVSGTGSIVLAPSTADASIGVATGGSTGFQIAQDTIDQFGGFSTVVIGRVDGTGKITLGDLTLPTGVRVRSGSGNVSFDGTVNSFGAARDLEVTTSGLTTFNAAVGGSFALDTLTVTHDVALNGARVNTLGAQSYGGDATLLANTELRGTAVAFGADLAAGAFDLRVFANAFALDGLASGTGQATLATRSIDGSIGLAGAGGTLQLSQGLIDRLAGLDALTVGRSDGTGDINANTLRLPIDLRLQSASGDVAFTGTVNSAGTSAHGLSVATGGATTLGAAVGAVNRLARLQVQGSTALDGGEVATTGTQNYGGAVTLGADTVLRGSGVTLAGTTDGAHALAVNATHTRFGAAVGAGTALTRLTTDAAGSTRLTGDVTTTGAQTYSDTLQLDADVTLTASALRFTGSIDGARALTLDSGSTVSFGGAVGAATALARLAVDGDVLLGAGSVRTTGSQSYDGSVTLASDTTLAASALTVGGAVDGAHALTVQTAGKSRFGAAIGAGTALDSLILQGGGAVQLLGTSVTTGGAQAYSGDLQLNGSTRLTGTGLTFGGSVAGAQDLQLNTNTLSVAGTLGGTGVLSIATLNRALGIGIAGGTGTLQVTQAVLDGASGFTQHILGRSDGTGAIDAGTLQLRADTTLRAGSGDLRLNGAVDGAFDLALNSAGNTRIAGPVGGGTALRSLATDAAGDTTLRGNVRTTGSQTWADPLQADGPLSLSGSVITAEQATNRFDGALTVRADSLQLRSASALTLADVTLASGGRIEADGVLTLSGAMALNGGTLTLVSNATPTAVDFSDPELQGRNLSFGLSPVKEASATIVQTDGATLASAAGSLLVLRSPQGGTLQLNQAGNTLLGDISAVSGPLGDNSSNRFVGEEIMLGFVRITSSEIHVAGAPPAAGAEDPGRAGIEGDVLWLSADQLTTGPTGLLRARLPFDNSQGSQTSVAGLTLTMGSAALDLGGGFGTPSPDGWIQVRVGSEIGGYLTLRPKGVSGDNAFVLLGGAEPKPFYDGAGKATEVRVFYNGDTPRTPQESGALQAVTAVVEDARHARFEEAVRTENVSSRLRSGVIAEVGAGRPATVGRESIRLPQSCNVKPNSLACE